MGIYGCAFCRNGFPPTRGWRLDWFCFDLNAYANGEIGNGFAFRAAPLYETGILECPCSKAGAKRGSKAVRQKSGIITHFPKERCSAALMAIAPDSCFNQMRGVRLGHFLQRRSSTVAVWWAGLFSPRSVWHGGKSKIPFLEPSV